MKLRVCSCNINAKSKVYMQAVSRLPHTKSMSSEDPVAVLPKKWSKRFKDSTKGVSKGVTGVDRGQLPVVKQTSMPVLPSQVSF